jgi:hypothetical protein
MVVGWIDGKEERCEGKIEGREHLDKNPIN